MQRIHALRAPRIRHIITGATLALLVAAGLAVAQTPAWVANAAPSGWTQVAHLNTGRFNLAAAATFKIYAIGGGDLSGNPLNTVEAYDPSTNTWTTGASLPTARVGLAATLASDGRIYAIGGLVFSGINGNALNTVESYSSVANSWAPAPSLNTARYDLVAANGPDGRIYAIGGLGQGGTPVNTVEAYTPTSHAWITVATSVPPGFLAQAAATGPDGLIYIIGGLNASGNGNTVEAYDPIANTWTAVASTPTIHNNPAATAGPDGRIYVVGGFGASGSSVSTVDAYDTNAKSWTSVASLPSTRWALAAATGPDGLIYAIGGYDTSDNLANSVQAFNPVATTSAGGTINGTVHLDSATGAGVSGAPVQACTSSNFCLATQTAADGSFSLTPLPDGAYSVTAQAPANAFYNSGSAGPISISGANTVSAVTVIETTPHAPPVGTSITGVGVAATTYGNGIPRIFQSEASTLTATGCAGGSASYQVNFNGGVISSGTMTEGSSGGTYTATIAPLAPAHGSAQISIDFACAGGTTPSITFDLYIDPSGTVQDQFGHPLLGAVVTLLQPDNFGTWAPVPGGSPIMAPANRNNPDTTDQNGRYGWDVTAGTYKIRATDALCINPNSPLDNSVESGALNVPPAVTGVDLQLTCIEADTTPPTITASAAKADGNPYTAGSWTNQSVTVSFSCTDDPGGSGVKSVSGLMTLNSEGANQSATGTCSDNAGNTASVTFSPINIDKTPPTIAFTGRTPPNVAGWNNTSVTLNWSCSDALSGPQSPAVAQTITSEGSNQTATATCGDNAGNTVSDTEGGVNIDETAPSTTASPTAGGSPYSFGSWTNHNVQVTLGANDNSGGSGVAQTYYAVDKSNCDAQSQQDLNNCTPYGGSITISSEGVHTLTYFSEDNSGNFEAPHTASVQIDKTAPAITLTTPAGKATYTLNQVVSADYICDDGSGSGVASCAGTVPSGTALDTSALGPHSFTVNAQDNAGNASSVTHTYVITCPTSGVLQPVNADGSSIFKQGSTVPVKVQLMGTCAGLANATLTLYVAQVSNGVTGTVMEAASTSAADSGNTFRYDATAGQYVFNLGTKSLNTGTYQLSIYIGGTNTTGALLLQVNISLK